MPTKSLTDQMFANEQGTSLTDQMFSQPQESLTDQMFAEPKIAPVTESVDTLKPETSIKSGRIHGIAKDFYKQAWGLDIDNPPPYKGQIDNVLNTLTRLKSLAKNPYDIIKGMGEFYTAVPSFIGGVGAGIVKTLSLGPARELEFSADSAQPFSVKVNWTWNDLYNNMIEEASRTSEQTVGLASEILNIPRTAGHGLAELVMDKQLKKSDVGDSSLVSEIIMAPLTVASHPVHALADKFEDEDLRGLLHIAAEGVGFAALGAVHGRGRGRNNLNKELVEKAEPIIEKATKIQEAQQAVNEIPNEVIKKAQQRIIDIERQQLELEAKALREKVEVEIGSKVELADKGEQIAEWEAEYKEYQPETPDRLKIKQTKEVELVEPTELDKVKKLDRLKSKQSLPKEKDETYRLSGVEVRYDGKYTLPEGELHSITIISEGPTKGATTSFTGKITKKNINDAVSKLKQRFEPATEVDLQTGTKKPDKLTTKGSPFRQSKEVTEHKTRVFKENADIIADNPEAMGAKLINDVNLWLDGKEGIDIAEVRNQLSEMAVNNEFSKKLKKSISEASAWARDAQQPGVKLTSGIDPDDVGLMTEVFEGAAEIVGVKDTKGTKLYSGIPLDEVAKTIVKGARAVSEYTQKARGMKAFKPRQAAHMLRENFNRSFIDRSGNIRRELLDQLGDEGYRVIQKMYLSKGASSLAALRIEQMRKEVYSGLSRHEKNVLDNIILSDRLLDIAKYKTTKQFKFPEGLDPKKNLAGYRELFEQIEKLTPEQAEKINLKAQAYFEWMKKPLKDMLNAELITEAEYNDLVSHNYRRIKLVDVFDKRAVQKVGAKKRTVYDSGVEALSRGRETDIFEPSSEIMALEVFNRAYGRILNNEANKGLLDLAREQVDNPFVRVKENRSDMIPSGWNRIFVYDKGERKAIYLSPEMAKEWITNSPELSYKMSQFIRYASGSPVTRTFATGINWGFALANLPRDVMHTWFTARTFKDGKWESVYSPHGPVSGLQITNDLRSVFLDAATKGKRYQEYIEQGGGMEFLVHQGRLFQRGRHIEMPLDDIYNFFGYFGETSEVMTRLAIRERVIKNRAKEQGITVEEARKNKDITREATFAARDYMDFSQGGGITKAVDNGIPYLNAAVQGSRGLFRAFKDNPAVSTYKLAQFTAVTTGLYLGAKAIHPETMKDMQGNKDQENNLIIPLGDKFGFVDERGQTRYPYLKIPIDPGQKFFKAFFEASADKMLGNEVDIDRVIETLKGQSPVDVTTLPPSVSGIVGYATNKDFWRNEDIWRKTQKPLSFPESKEEYIPSETPQALIDIGQMTGLSPERLKYALEELLTTDNMYSQLLGKGYDELFGTDIPEDMREKHLAMTLAQMPVVKRFFGVTNPYSKFGQSIDKVQEKQVVKRWIENRELDRLAEGYLFEDSVKRSEVVKYITSVKDRDTRDRLKDRFVFQETIKDLPNRSFWLRMKGLAPEARAKIYVNRLNSSSPVEIEEIRKELPIVTKAGGIINSEFRKQVMAIQGEESSLGK